MTDCDVFPLYRVLPCRILEKTPPPPCIITYDVHAYTSHRVIQLPINYVNKLAVFEAAIWYTQLIQLDSYFQLKNSILNTSLVPKSYSTENINLRKLINLKDGRKKRLPRCYYL